MICRVLFIGGEWNWEKGMNLFVLTKSDPDMEFVHGLPEHEGSKRHREVRRHFHHLSFFFSGFPL